HQQLPQMSGGALVGLSGNAEHRCVGDDDAQGPGGHDDWGDRRRTRVDRPGHVSTARALYRKAWCAVESRCWIASLSRPRGLGGMPKLNEPQVCPTKAAIGGFAV